MTFQELRINLLSESEVFQLRREGGEEDAETEVQSLSREAEINENLPLDEQNDPADDLPAEEDPGVERNGIIQEEPEREETVEIVG